MTPYFPGGSTPNGTPGGDKWARVLCGQIGWLSEPPHPVDADCSGSTNLKMQTHGKSTKKSRSTENTPRNPHQPGDCDHLETARKKHVSRVNPYSPASIDTGFAEMGLARLSQSVKTTNVTHTDRYRQTD